MARKKSVEEHALEAEARTADSSAARREGSGKTKGDAVLPEAGAKSRKKAHAKPHLPAKLSFLKTAKGKAAAAVTAVVVVAAVAAGVFLAGWNSTDKWDGTQDTSWFDASNPKSSYTFTTAEQLAGLGKLIEDGEFMEGITFKLGCNLDMYEIEMKPIGSGRTIEGKTYAFEGNFDGQGHTVSGLNVVEDDWDCAGLFGAASCGYIKNLTVEGKVTGQVTVGGVVGYADSEDVVNCTNRCQVAALKTATSFYPVSADCGGVIGMWIAAGAPEGGSFELSGLVNEGAVSARAASVGGVIGLYANSNGNSVTAKDFTNKGSVELFCETEERDQAAGGVIGVVNSYGDANSFDKLVNEGEVSCSSVLSVGGVFGAFMPPQETTSVTNCENRGTVAANASAKHGHVAGIFGYIDDPAQEYEGCSNTGQLNATNGNVDDICTTDGGEVWDKWEEENPSRLY